MEYDEATLGRTTAEDAAPDKTTPGNQPDARTFRSLLTLTLLLAFVTPAAADFFQSWWEPEGVPSEKRTRSVAQNCVQMILLLQIAWYSWGMTKRHDFSQVVGGMVLCAAICLASLAIYDWAAHGAIRPQLLRSAAMTCAGLIAVGAALYPLILYSMNQRAKTEARKAQD